jgi:hypothetical protein
MRGFATTAIGVVEGGEIEMGHGISNLPCKMIPGQLRVEVLPGLGVFVPGGGKTS